MSQHDPFFDSKSEKILIIKLGALGDFVLSLAGMQAIRKHHPSAHITLLTTAPYRELAEISGLFDEIWIDERPKLLEVRKLLHLRRGLNSRHFRRVYDLQRNDRSGFYFKLMKGPKPQWVGKVAGCSHRYLQPKGKLLHIADREAEQLALVGIPPPGSPDLTFVERSLSLREELPNPFILLVPGGSAHRPEKRWPSAAFSDLVESFQDSPYRFVAVGGSAEEQALREIEEAGKGRLLNLCGKTDLLDLIALGRLAKAAVGNDTGPMHLVAAAGVPCLSLFSAASTPEKTAPRGPGGVRILQEADLANLSARSVVEALQDLLDG